MDEWLRVNGSCPLCRKRIADDANEANSDERSNSAEMLMVPLNQTYSTANTTTTATTNFR